MRRGRCGWLAIALCLAARPAAPFRLGVESPAFAVAHDGTAGGLLLRELQRQAVLIAARDELGLRTRDAVLGEGGGGAGSPSVVVVRTRVWRASRAELRLVTPASRDRPWVTFPISGDPLVDYPAFVTRCEAASRETYRVEVRAVVGATAGRPTAWADGPADPAALVRLVRMDVFSQCRAAQLLHAQIRAEGASVPRLTALVRAYANLGRLCGGEWSAEPKAYAARSLLYAERLVAHENGSAASLYARSYARGMAGLSAAALDDLAAAGDRPPPPWAAAVGAFARRDPAATAAAFAAGPWQVRPLAGLLTVFASDDDPRPGDVARATADLLSLDAGPLLLRTANVTDDDDDGYRSRLNEPAADVLAVVVREQLLADPPLPAAAAAAVAGIAPTTADGPADLAGLAKLGDALARGGRTDDAAEPSVAALASLVRQQAFAAVVARAAALRGAGDVGETAKYVAAAAPVWRAHPWGPLVEALGVDASADPLALRHDLERVPAAALGPWAENAADLLTGTNEETTRLLVERWRRPAHLLSDPVVDDHVVAAAADQARRCCDGGVAEFLRRARLIDPHSATLAAAYMDAVGPDAAATDDAIYEPMLTQVEAEFADRPTVVARAADWRQARGQFDRELALLRRLDEIDPAVDTCERLARVCRRTGHAAAAVAYCVRGARLAGDTADEPSADGNDRAVRLYQLAAAGLIADGDGPAALAMLRRGTDTPNFRSLGLAARCDERMGHLDEAEACLRERTGVAPLSVVAYALWARRLGRPSAADLHEKAAAAVAKPGVGPAARRAAFYLALADGQPRRAVELLQQGGTDPADWPQVAAVAAALGDAGLARSAIDRSAADTPAADDPDGEKGPCPFGRAFAALARSPDAAAAAATFDRWCDRQLDPYWAVDWHGVAGRYLLSTGHPAEGRAELAAALASGATEREEYFLAWQVTWRAEPATQP